MATSKRYEEASKKYQEAMQKYSGDAAWNKAKSQSKEYQQIANDATQAQVQRNSRNSGYGKALSTVLGNQAGKEAAVENAATGFNTSLSNSNQAVANADKQYENSMNAATKIQENNAKMVSAIGNTVGGLINPAADVTTKIGSVIKNAFDKKKSGEE